MKLIRHNFFISLTAKTFGPHAQPTVKSPGMGTGQHLFNGELYNAGKNIVVYGTVEHYLGDNWFSTVADFFNPVSIGKDIFDIADMINEVFEEDDSGTVICPTE